MKQLLNALVHPRHIPGVISHSCDNRISHSNLIPDMLPGGHYLVGISCSVFFWLIFTYKVIQNFFLILSSEPMDARSLCFPNQPTSLGHLNFVGRISLPSTAHGDQESTSLFQNQALPYSSGVPGSPLYH